MNVPTPHKISYGDLEEGRVDGQTAWAWMEVWRDNGLHEVAYRSVIPYDSVTYVVDFVTDALKFMSRPDSMRAIVSTFAIGADRVERPAHRRCSRLRRALSTIHLEEDAEPPL